MDIYALLLYDKNTGALILSDKCFLSHDNAVMFLKDKKFTQSDKENDVFVASKHFCRIKKIKVCEQTEAKQLSAY